jgi:hypothetical protein
VEIRPARSGAIEIRGLPATPDGFPTPPSAWRWHVTWLAWFAFDGQHVSAAMRTQATQATQRANNILNGNFETHPGFNV